MNVEMQTHHSCCCNANTAQSKAIDDRQTGESFSAVFTSVSISTYFNPWTGESAPATQAATDNNNSLQSVLQSLPNVKLDPKSWLSPQGFHDSLFLVRTMAIRLIRQSQQEAQLIRASEAPVEDNQIKENIIQNCDCEHEENTITAEHDSNLPEKDAETVSREETTLQEKNDLVDQKHVHSSSSNLALDNVSHLHPSSTHPEHIHTSAEHSQQDKFWIHSPGKGKVFTHFKTHFA